MGRLIKIHEIDSFSKITSIPDDLITPQIHSNIKLLHEIEELERFIREILYDYNETPHDPTEIADILTSKVEIRGKRVLAAFVLKGKSFKKICPADGTPYDENGKCPKGHIKDELPIEWKVAEKETYTIIKQSDISFGGAKRYTADIFVDKHYSREVIRKIIQNAIARLQNSNYYRNDITKKILGKFKGV